MRDEMQMHNDVLDQANKLLSETGLFDAAVLIGTWQDEDGNTQCINSNFGNWYTQNGLLQHWATYRKGVAITDARIQNEKEIEEYE